MKHINFTYNRNFRTKPSSIQLSESEKDSAYLQFMLTGLDASEWLTWLAQYSSEYIKAAMPQCKHCGGSIQHSEVLIRRGNHGSDPLVNHMIECQDCGVVYADYTGLPGVTLDTIRNHVEGN